MSFQLHTLSIVCPLFKRGDPNFENFKKGEGPEKNFWVEETKSGEIFSKIKGGTQHFKLNLGIEKNKNGNFYR